MSNITNLINNIRKAVYGKDVRESIASAIEQTYEDASEQGNANMEVSEARGTFATLNQRLNNSDNAKAEKTEVNNEITERTNADNNLQLQINSLASGSPKGTYSTVSALISDNPATGVYIVQADGHIYSWTKDDTNAIDLGLYQSTGIADNSIETNMLKNNCVTYEKIDDLYLKAIEDSFKDKNMFNIDTESITKYTIDNFNINNNNISASIGTAVAYPFIFTQAYKYLIIPKINIASEGYLTIGLFSEMSGQIQNETNLISKIKYYLKQGTYFNLIIPLDDLDFSSLSSNTTYYLAMYKLTNEENPTYNSLETLSIPATGNSYNTGNFIDFNSDLKYLLNYSSWTWNTLGSNFYSVGIIQFGLSNQIPLTLNYNNLKESYFSDKTINFLGDSITYGYNGNFNNDNIARVDYPYPIIVQNLLNVELCNNYGVNGSTISGTGNNEDEVAGTSPMNIRYTNMDNDADFIIVMGGTNDHGQSIPLGTNTDTTNVTFYGALDVLINGLINKYPTKRIAFMTPIKKGNSGANTLGFTFEQYIEAIKYKCTQYSIPYLDLYTKSGCNPSITVWKNNNLPDALHPNQNYYYVLAKKIANFIESL